MGLVIDFEAWDGQIHWEVSTKQTCRSSLRGTFIFQKEFDKII